MSVIPCPAALLALLRCPVSGAALVRVGDELISTDPVTRRAYPLRAGLPVMLVDASRVLSEPDWQAALAAADPPPAK